MARCQACKGVWAHYRSALAAPVQLPKTSAVLAAGSARQGCRACGQPAPEQRCRSCGADQALACPSCQRTMDIAQVDTLCIDVCKGCEAAWFDAGELGAIARRHRARLEAVMGAEPGRRPAARNEATGTGATDRVLKGADAVGATELAGEAAGEVAIEAGLEAAAGVGNLASQAGHTVAAKTDAGLDALGDAAVAVVEGIGDVLGGLFDGL